ncbi:MAG: malto-oligosyltrehalose synthase [Catalinimonas sp.]
MTPPIATYRVQLHAGFGLRDLLRVVPYLDALGVSTIYASPIFQARVGSTHGYDQVDPQRLNDALGTEADLEELSHALATRGMTWLQDVVPNHMAYDAANPWLWDVLEKGERSPYARFFDVDWAHPDEDLRGRIATPFLGKPLEEVTRDGELQLHWEDEGGFTLGYYDQRYPLSPASYPVLLEAAGLQLADDVTEAKRVCQHLVESFKATAEVLPAPDQWENLKARLRHEAGEHSGLRDGLARAGGMIAADPTLLRQLLDLQHYLLMHWQQTERRINYRRFFTVNDLICVRVEDDEVFGPVHQYLKTLLARGQVQGVRVDHVDGLFDPAGYLQRLRALVGEETYLLVEKILEEGEELPGNWPVEGTSGYEFLAQVSQLFTDPTGQEALEALYHRLVPDTAPYEAVVREQKRFVLRERMGGELTNLLHLLAAATGEAPSEAAREALAELLVSFPVYRTYLNRLPWSDEDRAVVDVAFTLAEAHRPDRAATLAKLRKVFETDDPTAEQLYFLRRLQQFTGPLMAKGVEDTTFYRYQRLISHNEVGDQPAHLGLTGAQFHAWITARGKKWPHAMNTTATHDTKRGEDARLRINVLSEMPDTWAAVLAQWRDVAAPFRTEGDGGPMPTAGDEYFIYQTLLGATPADGEMTDAFGQRLRGYLVKALREGKERTSWSQPDEAYETACTGFADRLLTTPAFLDLYKPFRQHVARIGSVYSLGQTLLRLMVPGVPDTYQGTEDWDLSLVDPDNRRPFSYATRQNALNDLTERFLIDPLALVDRLLSNPLDFRIKLFVLHRALSVRRGAPGLFAQGDYQPVELEGPHADHVVAFTRNHRGECALVVVPHRVATLMHGEQVPVGDVWRGTTLKIGKSRPRAWVSALTSESLNVEGEALALADVLRHFPVGLWTSR